MTIVSANKLISSLSLNLAIDGLITPPLLESAALNYLLGKISRMQLQAKAQSMQTNCSMLFFRAIELFTAPLPTTFNIDTFLNLHTYLHLDQYPKCGTLRKANLESVYGSHTDYKYLKGSLKNVLSRLNSTKASPQISKVDFTAILAHYFQELNILSPFLFDNGISRRCFMALFALSRGFEISYAMTTKKDLIYAENQAFLADNPQALFACLTKCISYIGQTTVSSPRTFSRTRNPRFIKSIKKVTKQSKKQKNASIIYTAKRKSDAPNLSVTQELLQPPISAQTPDDYTDYDDVNQKIKTIQEKLYSLNKELNDIVNSIKK